MRGINPAYLDRLEESQRAFILTGPGKFFADSFIFMPAEHGYVIGPTGSGKTNKMHNLANWLKYTETILWISASKDQDILPLFFMGLPVNIIIPKYAGVKIMLDRQPFDNVSYTEVNDPGDVFYAIRGDYINILEVRNAFWDKDKLLDWMILFFKTLSEGCRRGTIPRIAPPSWHGEGSKVTVFIDESQWLIAGTKVTNDPKRVKATEEIAGGALEIRTYGWRLIISSQGFTNVVPIIRENMPCVFLCVNAQVNDVPALHRHCQPHPNTGWKPTSRYKRNEYKFVNRSGVSSPNDRPLPVPWYPKKEEDKQTITRMGIEYARRYHDRPPESAEPETECLPELGRFSAMAIPPEKAEVPTISRFGQVIEDGRT
jgi:hypothetical protein